MRTGGGDFTPEAYEQLKEAYAKEAQDAKSVEQRGHDIMGLNLGLETMPVDSPWADLVTPDQYPSGKSEYLDGKQDPAEILELMRSSVTKPDEVEEEEDEDEEVLEVEEEEVETEEDEVEEEEDEEEDEEDEEDSDDDDDEREEEDDDVEEEGDDEVEEEDLDADAIAAEIAELRAELEQMQFVSETQDDESE